MAKRVVIPAIALVAVVMFSVLVRTQQAPPNRQPGAVYDVDFPGQKSGPAPRRSLSGVWEFAQGRNVAIQADGAKEMPLDGKPDHDLPFRPRTRAFMANNATLSLNFAGGVFRAVTFARLWVVRSAGFPRMCSHNAPTRNAPSGPVVIRIFNKKCADLDLCARAHGSRPARMEDQGCAAAEPVVGILGRQVYG